MPNKFYIMRVVVTLPQNKWKFFFLLFSVFLQFMFIILYASFPTCEQYVKEYEMEDIKIMEYYSSALTFLTRTALICGASLKIIQEKQNNVKKQRYSNRVGKTVCVLNALNLTLTYVCVCVCA